MPELALVNTGAAPVQITRFDCDPLVDRETGAAMKQALSAALPVETVPPAGTARVELGGYIPARPGAYASTIRVMAGEDKPPLAIPLSVTVAASTWRGVLCTLLGLVVAAVLFLLQRRPARPPCRPAGGARRHRGLASPQRHPLQPRRGLGRLRRRHPVGLAIPQPEPSARRDRHPRAPRR